MVDIHQVREDMISVMEDILYEIDLHGKGLDNELSVFHRSLLEKIQSIVQSLKSPFKIAVLGHQGSGKSTLINLLLQEEIMPSTIFENEVAVVKVKKLTDKDLSDKVKAIFYRGGKYDEEILNKESFYQMIDYSRDGKHFIESEKYKDLAYFELYSNNEILDKIEIVNTPGMNVVTANFYEKVRPLFMEADVIIWVVQDDKPLDKFNKDLIENIYKDNKNIIGVLTHIDHLYKQDPENGVLEVIDTFVKEVENGKLYRVNGKICLFPYNGLAAEIAMGIKKNIIALKEDLDTKEDDIKAIINYLDHSFAYSDDKEILSKLKNLNLYIPEKDINKISLSHEENFFMKTTRVMDLQGDQYYLSIQRKIEELQENFDIDSAIEFLESQNVNIIEEDGKAVLYTENGKKVLLGMSRLGYIEDFAHSYLFRSSLNKKLTEIFRRFNNLYEENNIYGNIKNLNQKFHYTLKKLDTQKEAERQEFEDKLNEMRTKYESWKRKYIPILAQELENEFLNKIFEKIDAHIGYKDLFLEAIYSLPFFKSSPISRKFENIINETLKDMLLIESKSNTKALNELIEESIKEIENLMSEYFVVDAKNRYSISDHQHIPSTPQLPIPPESVEYREKMVEIVKKLTKVFLKNRKIMANILKKIAKRDLRKKTTRMKKMFIKFIRKFLKKLGIKSGKILSESNPITYFMAIYDIVMIFGDIKSLKKEIQSQMKDEFNKTNEFGEYFYQTADKIASSLMEEAINYLKNMYFRNDKSQIADVNKKIDYCESIIAIMDRVRNSVIHIYNRMQEGN